jgi:beta-lactamase regulating signal transducer with metallopeptidase domain
VLLQQPAAVAPTDSGRGWQATVGRPLFLAWLIGVAFCVVRLAAAWFTALRWRLKSVPVTDARVLALYNRVADSWRLRPPPHLRACDDVTSPMLVGIVTPVILFPAAGIDRTSPDDLRLIVSHELAHYERHDLLWEWLLAAGSVLFFFHPLVWLARREWSLARESSCDALAIRRAQSDPDSYADMLLRLWRRVSSPSRAPFTAMGVAEELRTAKRRLDAMTCCSLLRPGVLQAVLVLTLALGAGILVPWRLTAAADPAEGAPPRRAPDETSRVQPPDGRAGGAASVVIQPGDAAASSVTGPGTARPRRRAVVSSP